MRSADLIREARLRAGLTQYELAERSGRDRSVIARWEQGTVAPSIETLVELVRACGFDLPLELVPHDSSSASGCARTRSSRPSGACSGSCRRRAGRAAARERDRDSRSTRTRS